jgi:hypothetical protein
MRLSKFNSPSFVYASLVVFFITLFPIVGLSQQKTQKKLNVAVLDFDTRGAITKDEATSLSDMFQSYLVDTKEFNVLDRARIKSILAELGFQETGVCSDVECVVEAGKLLKAEKMFAGTIGRVGKIYSINIQLIDVATAQIEDNKSRQHDGAVEAIAESIIPEIVEEIATQMVGREIKVKRMSVGTSWLWYAGGVVLVGGGVAAYLFLKPQETTQQKTLPTPPALPQ